jgi:hypothetical protein
MNEKEGTPSNVDKRYKLSAIFAHVNNYLCSGCPKSRKFLLTLHLNLRLSLTKTAQCK